MKKVKIAFWVIVFGFLALVIFQNQEFFLARQSLDINLYMASYQTPSVPNAVLFVAFFLAGLLIAYFFSLFERFKANKTIKSLNAALKANEDSMAGLKKDVDAMKASAAQTAPDVVEDATPAVDADATTQDQQERSTAADPS